MRLPLRRHDGLIFLYLVASLFPSLQTLATVLKAPAPLAAEPSDNQIGKGLLVWESARAPWNRWRIWAIDLPDGEPRQLSDGPATEDHYAPHLSPDGQHLVYSSYPGNHNGYEPPRTDIATPLRLVHLDSGVTRDLVPSAKTYWEHRCAVWLDDVHLAYIAPDGSTKKIHIHSGEQSTIIPREGNVPSRADAALHGLLPSPQLDHATAGYPTFSPLKDGQIDEKRIHFGCQPYFTYDGRWGYWMGGVGGPIARYDLETRRESSILNRFDPRITDEGWGFLYFPMVSRCGRALAFGASQGEHDHWNADYEIFLVPLQGDSLEVTGTPRRMTHWKGTDRFPDVFVEPLALGSYSGEGPSRFSLPIPAGAPWSINGHAQDPTEGPVEVAFDKPGLYQIEAVSDDSTTRGRVRVATARPPAVVQALTVGFTAGWVIELVFDEPVVLQEGAMAVAGTSGVALGPEHLESDRRLTLPVRGFEENPNVVLSGVTDTAQIPNAVSSAAIPVQVASWPSKAIGGWKFGWWNGKTELDGILSGALRLTGSCFYDETFRIRSWNGGAVFAKAGEPIAEALESSGTVYAEAVIQPESAFTKGSESILCLTAKGKRLFSLTQIGGALYADVLTKGGLVRDPRINAQAPLRSETYGPKVGDLEPGEPIHVALRFDGTEFCVFLDGEEALRTDRFQGSLLPLEEKAYLCAGFRGGQSARWNGTIGSIAISDTMPTDEQIATSASVVKSMLLTEQAQSTPPAKARVGLKLTALSEHPTLEQIKPYREALVVGEATVQYIIGGAIEGVEVGSTVRIAQWSILDGKNVIPRLAAPGTDQQIDAWVTPFASQPQLKATSANDTLEPDFSSPYLYVLPER